MRMDLKELVVGVILRISLSFSAIVYALNRVLRRSRTAFQEEMQI